jgi:hypothetical protein
MSWRYNRYRSGFAPKPKADASEIPDTGRIKKLLPGATAWAETFLKSILEQVEKGRTLSVAQVETFKKLEVSLTKGVQDNVAFAKTFTKEQREKYRVACEYYSTTVYYGQAISEYKEQVALGTFSSFIPSARNFVTLVENKYFTKIWVAHRAVPRFHCGDLVVMREYVVKGFSRIAHYRVSGGEGCLVLKIDPETPVSPAAGSKLYLVAALANNEQFLTEERYLKPLKGVK